MTQMFLDNTAYVGDGDGDVGRFDVLEIEMVAVDTSTRVLEFPWKNRSRLNSDTLRHSCKAAMLQDLRKKTTGILEKKQSLQLTSEILHVAVVRLFAYGDGATMVSSTCARSQVGPGTCP